MIDFGWISGLIPLSVVLLSLIVIIIIMNIVIKIHDPRSSASRWIGYLIGLILIIILVILSGCYVHYHIYGSKLPAKTRLGFYGHKKPLTVNVSHLYELNASKHIYLSKTNINWDEPYCLHGYTYYFPKNMPDRTRMYILNHSKYKA